MLNRDLTVYFLLGFFFVGYLGLDITAVAIFAAILAVILTGPVSYTHLSCFARRAVCRNEGHRADDPWRDAEPLCPCYPAG